jgi:hypothetical protein
VPKKKRKGPAVSFGITTRVDPTLGPTEVVVLGQRIDLAKVGDKVRVSGPRDSRTCPICIQYVGNVYKRGDPRIAMFGPGGDGAHPRDRHYLVPMGMPGLDEEIQEPGLDYVRRLKKDRKEKDLANLYGKKKAEWILKYDIDPDALYRPDGAPYNLDELVEQGIVPEEALNG